MSNSYDPTSPYYRNPNPANGTGIGAKGAISIGGYATALGGLGNQYANIEGLQDRRLAQLGANVPASQLPAWEQNQLSEFQGWGNESQAMQQDAFKQAQQLAKGGPNTAGQQQLALGQQAQTGGVTSMARGVSGGARGAAAGAGRAVQQAGALGAQQSNQSYQQSLEDKAAGAQMMGSIANQQRGLQQGQYDAAAQLGTQNAAYQQGWQGLNDSASQWANTMGTNRAMQDMGFQNQAQNQYAQNQIFQQQQDQQLLGAGIGASGTLIAGGLGYGGGGAGGGGGSSPYGLGNNAENPWWNG